MNWEYLIFMNVKLELNTPKNKVDSKIYNSVPGQKKLNKREPKKHPFSPATKTTTNWVWEDDVADVVEVAR